MIEWFNNLSEGWKITIFVVIIAPVATVIIKWLFGNIAGKKKERKIYLWLKKNTEDRAGKQFKTTNEISQGLGIDEEKVKKICTLSKRIYQRSDSIDSWGIYSNNATSIYEERGPIII